MKKGRYPSADMEGFYIAKVRCYNAGEGCDYVDEVRVEEGRRPPRIICPRCKATGAPSTRRHIYSDDRGHHGTVKPSVELEVQVKVLRPGDPGFAEAAAQCTPPSQITARHVEPFFDK